MKRPIINIAIILCLLSIAGCNNKKQQNTKSQQKVLEVVTAKPQLTSITDGETFSATIEAFVKNNIAPQAPNRISRIAVEVGQTVAKGQLLAIMDDAQLAQLELKINNSATELKRLDELYKIGGISKSNWEAAQMAYNVDKTAFRNLKENTQLVSPINGVITARNYDSGDMYSPQMPLLIVEQLAPLKLKVNVSERYFPKFTKGLPVKITCDLFPDEEFDGKVALVAPTINPTSRTFEAEIHLPNQDKRLRPGMYAHAKLSFGQEEALLIPDIAVKTLPGTGEKYVFVLNSGKAVLKPVQTGRIIGDKVVVLKGITENDTLITTGLTRLKNGDSVTVSLAK